MGFLSKFKLLTHGIAVGVAGAAGYLVAHPQLVQAIVQAAPKLAPLGAAIPILLALYHDPKSKSSDSQPQQQQQK